MNTGSYFLRMIEMISVQADYKKTGIRRYDDNPFIEALPPILEPEDVISA